MLNEQGIHFFLSVDMLSQLWHQFLRQVIDEGWYYFLSYMTTLLGHCFSLLILVHVEFTALIVEDHIEIRSIFGANEYFKSGQILVTWRYINQPSIRSCIFGLII